MKNKLTLMFIFLISSLFCISQTNFEKGFKIGFAMGYCQDQGVSCVAPIPPIAPLPNTDEDINSKLDGYNRGFVVGQNARKRNSGEITNSSSYDNTSNHGNNIKSSSRNYKTAKSQNVDYIYKGTVNENNFMQVSDALYNMKGKAVDYLNNGEYQSCIDICIKGLNISPYDSEFMLFIGESFRKDGDIENAIKWYKKALRFRSNDTLLNKMVSDLSNQGFTNIKLTY